MFKLKIVLCLISVNFLKNEKYVLSTNPDKIILPNFELVDTNDMTNAINSQINSLFVSNLRSAELNRIKFVSFNDGLVKNMFAEDIGTIHVLYGGTMPHIETNQHWFSFDYMDLNIQKELSIINKTIQHVI